jgi:hypothetical protein
VSPVISRLVLRKKVCTKMIQSLLIGITVMNLHGLAEFRLKSGGIREANEWVYLRCTGF